MRLTQFTDYALRLLLYLGSHPNRVVPVTEVADAYGVSLSHLVKVAHRLARSGIVRSTRGRGGGLQLNRPPEKINLGELIRLTETDLNIVECFDTKGICAIDGVCKFKHVIEDAMGAFFEVVDATTLADLLDGKRENLKGAWSLTIRKYGAELTTGASARSDAPV